MIRVYVAGIESVSDSVVENKIGLLKPMRQQKIRSYRSSKDRYRSLVAGFLLKYALEARGVDYDSAEFSEDENGKPFLLGDAGICFSISHAAAYAAVAVSEHSVGVDIESTAHFGENPLERIAHLKKRILCEQEAAYLSGVPDAQKPDMFCRFWTGKEAYVKCDGAGMRMDFRGFSVLGGDFYWEKIADTVWLGVYPAEKEQVTVEWVSLF